MEANDAPEPKAPPPVLSLKDQALGLILHFQAPEHLNPGRVGKLLRDEVPVIRRFLDDPVNWPVVGRKPDRRRNAFLGLLLSIDRVGGSGFSVLPLDKVCDLKRHAKSYSGPPCALCVVMRLLGRVHGEKLVRITKVVGEADDKGHYLHAESIAFEPAEEFPPYREKIKRLPLPALLANAAPAPSAAASGPAAASTLTQLAAIRITSWAKLTIDVHADSFRAGEVTGYPSDLGLAQHEWSLFCDLAKARGKYAPKLLGPAAQRVRDNMARISAALKRAFPQILDEPIKRAGTGSYEAVFAIQAGDLPLEKLGW